MAVDLTVAQLSNALRLGDTAEELEIVTRLLGVASALVSVYAPNAPDAIANEAAVRLAGYLFDQPTAPARSSHANALRNSGAAALLASWRVQRATPLQARAPDASGNYWTV